MRFDIKKMALVAIADLINENNDDEVKVTLTFNY